ncbi:MAG: isoprenyl transferase [Myxococcota bacterium]
MNQRSTPRHIAIIMDGNGRWAEDRRLPRLEGHRAGARTVRDITTYARELGVRYLTLYAFSSENWGRPGHEVGGLMELLREYLVEERKTLLDNRIELSTIGDTARLPAAVRLLLNDVMGATRGLDGMRLTLALSYGGRDEILRAVRGIAHAVDRGDLDPEEISAAHLEDRLDTAGVPDPDLLIRTSGEQRISNFLLWQLAYAELYFTEVPWPAFARADLDKALVAYANRQRRFGLTGGQVNDRREQVS